jgi:hypothetical protein
MSADVQQISNPPTSTLPVVQAPTRSWCKANESYILASGFLVATATFVALVALNILSMGFASIAVFTVLGAMYFLTKGNVDNKRQRQTRNLTDAHLQELARKEQKGKELLALKQSTEKPKAPEHPAAQTKPPEPKFAPSLPTIAEEEEAKPKYHFPTLTYRFEMPERIYDPVKELAREKARHTWGKVEIEDEVVNRPSPVVQPRETLLLMPSTPTIEEVLEPGTPGPADESEALGYMPIEDEIEEVLEPGTPGPADECETLRLMPIQDEIEEALESGIPGPADECEESAPEVHSDEILLLMPGTSEKEESHEVMAPAEELIHREESHEVMVPAEEPVPADLSISAKVFGFLQRHPLAAAAVAVTGVVALNYVYFAPPVEAPPLGLPAPLNVTTAMNTTELKALVPYAAINAALPAPAARMMLEAPRYLATTGVQALHAIQNLRRFAPSLPAPAARMMLEAPRYLATTSMQALQAVQNLRRFAPSLPAPAARMMLEAPRYLATTSMQALRAVQNLRRFVPALPRPVHSLASLARKVSRPILNFPPLVL